MAMVLWGTGLGALIPGSDAAAPQAGTIRNDVIVYVDGIPSIPFTPAVHLDSQEWTRSTSRFRQT